jgi:hypothetical protein
MYVHKKCAPSGAVLDMEKRVGGFCGFCNQQGTVYHVEGQPDYYEHVLAGVLYKVLDGTQYNTREAVRERFRRLNAEAKARRKADFYNETHPVWDQAEPEDFARFEEREVAESIPEPVKIAEVTAEIEGERIIAGEVFVEAVSETPMPHDLEHHLDDGEESSEPLEEEIVEEVIEGVLKTSVDVDDEGTVTIEKATLEIDMTPEPEEEPSKPLASDSVESQPEAAKPLSKMTKAELLEYARSLENESG